MVIIFCILVFIFGAVIGSFLNCATYRLELARGLTPRQSFWRGRSFCPKCKRSLSFWDLIPIISFLGLKGKCRYCKTKISWQYLAVEIMTGLLFLLIFNFQFSIFPPAMLRIAMQAGNQAPIFQFSNLISFIYLIIIASLLIIIFLYDLKNYIIPDKILFPAIGIALIYQIIFNFQFSIFNEFSITNFQTRNFYFLLLGAVLSGGFFFLIWAISRGKWMGFGDVKLAFFIGLFLGFPNTIVALFLSFLLGAIIGIILMILGKKKMKSQVPFGPFMIAGTFIALFWSEALIRWYLSLINYSL